MLGRGMKREESLRIRLIVGDLELNFGEAISEGRNRYPWLCNSGLSLLESCMCSTVHLHKTMYTVLEGELWDSVLHNTW